MRLTLDDRPSMPAGYIDLDTTAESDEAAVGAMPASTLTSTPASTPARRATRSRRAVPDLPDGFDPALVSLPMLIHALAVGGTRTVRRHGVAVAEHVPADTRAAVFWLVNRAPGTWGRRPDRAGLA